MALERQSNNIEITIMIISFICSALLQTRITNYFTKKSNNKTLKSNYIALEKAIQQHRNSNDDNNKKLCFYSTFQNKLQASLPKIATMEPLKATI